MQDVRTAFRIHAHNSRAERAVLLIVIGEALGVALSPAKLSLLSDRTSPRTEEIVTRTISKSAIHLCVFLGHRALTARMHVVMPVLPPDNFLRGRKRLTGADGDLWDLAGSGSHGSIPKNASRGHFCVCPG
jgi:hypothetical protein